MPLSPLCIVITTLHAGLFICTGTILGSPRPDPQRRRGYAFVSPPANSLDPEQTYIYVVELTLDLISHKSLSAFENHHQPHL